MSRGKPKSDKMTPLPCEIHSGPPYLPICQKIQKTTSSHQLWTRWLFISVHKLQTHILPISIFLFFPGLIFFCNSLIPDFIVLNLWKSLSCVWFFATPWTVARLLCPWNSPSKNTAVGCHFLLQGIFPTRGWNPGLLYYRQILYHLGHQGSQTLLWS